MEYLVFIGFVFFLSLLFMFFFISSCKSGTIEKALVVYGKLDPEDSLPFKVYTKGITFVFPIIQKYYYFWLDDYNIKSTEFYPDQSNVTHEFSFDIYVKPSIVNADLHRLISKTFGKNKHEIIQIFKTNIEQFVRDEISALTIQKDNHKSILKQLTKGIEKQVMSYGFDIPTSSNVIFENTSKIR